MLLIQKHNCKGTQSNGIPSINSLEAICHCICALTRIMFIDARIAGALDFVCRAKNLSSANFTFKR